MSSEKQESMLKKVLTHAVLTVTGVLVTAYATNLIKQTQFDEQKQEQAKQLVESSRVTNERLNDYMQRYDDLLAKYEELLLTCANQPASRGVPEDVVEAPPSVSVQGQWFTLDGTVVWSFGKDRVTVSGAGAFAGFMNGTGTYDRAQDTVTGEIRLTIASWVSTDETIRFSASVDREGNMMTGSLEDMLGQVMPLTLYRE